MTAAKPWLSEIHPATPAVYVCNNRNYTVKRYAKMRALL